MSAVALSIAGFDPSGGAGVLADLAIFRAGGLHGAAAVTAITAQDSSGVSGVWPLPAEWILRQARAVLADLPVRAIKIGMLGGAPQALAVAQILESAGSVPVVLDPVIRPKAGPSLLDEPGIEAVRRNLFPRASLLTPNVAEAAELARRPVRDRRDMEEAARSLLDEGASAVLVKGLRLPDGDVLDLLVEPEASSEHRHREIPGVDVHGSGCALSSAIACGLAVGRPLAIAVANAERLVHAAIGRSARLGKGAPFLPLALLSLAEAAP